MVYYVAHTPDDNRPTSVQYLTVELDTLLSLTAFMSTCHGASHRSRRIVLEEVYNDALSSISWRLMMQNGKNNGDDD